MNRCNFIKAASCGALLMGALLSVSHVAAENCLPILGLLGMLYDLTLCVGCQACVTKCQDINFPECNLQGEQTWLNNDKLLLYTNNIIQVWTSGTGVNKDQEENGYVYIKKQCMHCVDLNCVSVCLVSALKKDLKTGIVHYDKDVCTGCCYCMVACLYNVLKYDYNNLFGVLHKCELCNQKGVECLDKGGLPGCVEVCLVGVVIFGTCEELMVEAKKCLALKPGSEYHYLCQMLKSGDTYLHMVLKYYLYLYGEKEGGGTQVLVLMGVPYENLDLLKLDDLSTGACSENIQHTLYKGMMLPLAVLVGLTVLVCCNTKNDHHDGGDDHES